MRGGDGSVARQRKGERLRGLVRRGLNGTGQSEVRG
jgi:hypothetical protein